MLIEERLRSVEDSKVGEVPSEKRLESVRESEMNEVVGGKTVGERRLAEGIVNIGEGDIE